LADCEANQDATNTSAANGRFPNTVSGIFIETPIAEGCPSPS
jgi:hypothetical protein